MRARPHAFLRFSERWINMCLVTDIEDHGDELIVFMTSDMARLAGKEDPSAIDVARRFVIRGADKEKLEKWLLLNDED